jgi:hypothetical protein
MNRSPRPSRHFPIRTMLNRGETDVGSHVTARLITYAHSSMHTHRPGSPTKDRPGRAGSGLDADFRIIPAFEGGTAPRLNLRCGQDRRRSSSARAPECARRRASAP